jgi:hypothetical protein
VVDVELANCTDPNNKIAQNDWRCWSNEFGCELTGSSGYLPCPLGFWPLAALVKNAMDAPHHALGHDDPFQRRSPTRRTESLKRQTKVIIGVLDRAFTVPLGVELFGDNRLNY